VELHRNKEKGGEDGGNGTRLEIEKEGRCLLDERGISKHNQHIWEKEQGSTNRWQSLHCKGNNGNLMNVRKSRSPRKRRITCRVGRLTRRDARKNCRPKRRVRGRRSSTSTTLKGRRNGQRLNKPKSYGRNHPVQV